MYMYSSKHDTMLPKKYGSNPENNLICCKIYVHVCIPQYSIPNGSFEHWIVLLERSLKTSRLKSITHFNNNQNV